MLRPRIWIPDHDGVSMSNGEHCKDHPFYCDAAPAAVSQEQMIAYAHARGLNIMGVTTGRVSGAVLNEASQPNVIGHPEQLHPMPDTVLKNGMMRDFKSYPGRALRIGPDFKYQNVKKDAPLPPGFYAVKFDSVVVTDENTVIIKPDWSTAVPIIPPTPKE